MKTDSPDWHFSFPDILIWLGGHNTKLAIHWMLESHTRGLFDKFIVLLTDNDNHLINSDDSVVIKLLLISIVWTFVGKSEYWTASISL